MIRFEKVSKIYKMGDERIKALDEVSLEINNGDFVAIVGPSGSGKTTLANIIGGLDRPDKGKVIVNNMNLSEARDNKLSAYRNKNIGFVFQNFNLQFSYTALENVMVPLIFSKIKPSVRKEQAMYSLKAVGLDDRARHRPSQLSGGQRQRVCIARALVNNPSIIIADEPTGNLDSKKSVEIVKLLKDLNEDKGITVLIITHDKSVASKAKKVMKMIDGKI
ncbi:hypothetical protein LCGC14_1201790 [marine sediment metagenome]|uniref:ABC transporter domain-containing protein n=1 Tax=marine sediment metagenome TaxID=412755 RepID=A0A0F9M3Y1_9ZZZZ